MSDEKNCGYCGRAPARFRAERCALRDECGYANAELDRLRREMAKARELLQSTRNMWALVSQKAAFANGPARGHVCDYRTALQSAKDRALEEVARIDAAMAETKEVTECQTCGGPGRLLESVTLNPDETETCAYQQCSCCTAGSVELGQIGPENGPILAAMAETVPLCLAETVSGQPLARCGNYLRCPCGGPTAETAPDSSPATPEA